jgi:predicted aldo/keto reductase-like oxidoreductase
MTKHLTYLASAGLLGVGADALTRGTLRAADSAPASKLIMRPLGKTGISLPIVSMGVMNAEAPGLIVRSYEVGIRHFDTAAGYQGGRNEEMVGQTIRQLGVRDKVIISTKAHVRGAGQGDAAATKADMLKSFEGSLNRLQMDHVDILYLHAIGDAPPVDDAGVQAAVTQLKKEGKIRFAGVSTHGGQADVLNAVARGGFWDVALVGFNYTMSENQAMLDAMKLCASKGIGLVAMKTQAGGSKPPQQEMLGSGIQESVRQSAVLKWVLHHPFVTTAIPGFTKFEHIDMDIPVASNLAFTGDERKFLSNNAIKASLEFCQQCGECRGSCPNGVDVPTLMRSHMYVFQYANLDQARFALTQAPAHAGLEACRSCTDCSAACSHTVNIRRKVHELVNYPTATLASC